MGMLRLGLAPVGASLPSFRTLTHSSSLSPPPPSPMGGCGNPQLIRDILDCCNWLMHMPGYPLKGSMEAIRVEIEKTAEARTVQLTTHHDAVVFLPDSVDAYEGRYVTSAGRCNIPAEIPPWNTQTEKKFLDKFISDLNSNLLAGRDKEPNLSRSAKCPAMYIALRTGAMEKAVFVGGSNSSSLAFSASALGLDSYRISKGGWKLSKDNVDKLLPDLKDLLGTVPPDTPVVIFCLDNTSFLGLNEDGSMNAISRCVEEDDGFHVKGALVVAPEKAMKYFLEQLKRITSESGTHPVFVLTPWSRFVRVPCCDAAGHVTNFGDPDFLLSILSDLTIFKHQLRKAVSPAIVVDSLELVCGSDYSHEKVAQTINVGWASDPVHPNKHIYAKAALNLMEKMANNKPPASGSGLAQSRKRTWSASNASDNSGTSGRHGSGGGNSGNRGSPGGGGGTGGRHSNRSQQWQEMRRWNEPGYPRQGAAMRDNRETGSRGGGSGHSRWYDQGQPQYPREYGGGHYHGNYRGRGGYDRRYN
jgi:hypothetical protein